MNPAAPVTAALPIARKSAVEEGLIATAPPGCARCASGADLPTSGEDPGPSCARTWMSSVGLYPQRDESIRVVARLIEHPGHGEAVSVRYPHGGRSGKGSRVRS